MGKTGNPHKKMQLNSYITLYTIINSKQVEDLNVTLKKKVKLLEKHIGASWWHWTCQGYNGCTLKARKQKENRELELHKLIPFHASEEKATNEMRAYICKYITVATR